MPDTSWTPPGHHAPDGPDAGWTDLAAAAARLGISPDAARKRLERGTLRGEKHAGRWLVWLPDLDGQPDTPDATGRQSDAASEPASGRSDAAWTPPDAMASTTRELIEQLKEENTYLRDQLDQRSRELAAERERFDVLHREALARIPALGSGQNAPAAASGLQQAAEPQHTASDPSSSWWASWWRRLTGGNV